MARLERYAVEGDWVHHNGETWDEANKRQDALFNVLEQRSNNLPEGEVVGAILSWPVADGHANYVVTKAKPLTLKFIPYSDAYEVDPILIRGLNLKDVLKLIKNNKRIAQLFSPRKNKPESEAPC